MGPPGTLNFHTNFSEASGETFNHVSGLLLAKSAVLFINDNTPFYDFDWLEEALVDPTDNSQTQTKEC